MATHRTLTVTELVAIVNADWERHLQFGDTQPRDLSKGWCLDPGVAILDEATEAKEGSEFHQRVVACRGWRDGGYRQCFRRDNRDFYDVSWNNSGEDDSDEDEEDDEDEGTASLDISKTSKQLDKFLFFWHSALMITCLFLLIVGIVLRFHFTTFVVTSVKNNPYFVEYERFMAFKVPPNELIFGDLTQTLGDSLMLLNGVHILCIMMYMSFQIHKNHFTLPVVCFISGVVVIMEINTCNLYMSDTSAQTKEAKDSLKAKIKTIYNVEDSTAFSLTHDIIAVWGQCCGVNDVYDFQDLQRLKFSAKTDKERRLISVPPVCCNETFFSMGEKAKEAVMQCAITGQGVHTEGCYSVMYNWLKFYCIAYSVIIVIQLIDIFIHLGLYRQMITTFRDATFGQS